MHSYAGREETGMALKIAGAVGLQCLPADALGPVRADRGAIFDQDALHRRHVADCGDQIVVQVLALAGEELLHQREAEALRRAALDLAFDQKWD